MFRKNHNAFSFMIVLPGRKRTLTFEANQYVVKGTLVAVVLGFIALAIGGYMMYNTSIRQTQIQTLRSENNVQKAELKALNEQLETLKKDMVGLLEREEELRLILGDAPSRKTYANRYQSKKKQYLTAKSVSSVYDELDEGDDALTPEPLEGKVAFMKEVFADTKAAFSAMLDRAYQMKARFANTPSIPPLYGRRLSGFGMRRHPILGSVRMHKGVDIAAWWGAPVQATAAGVVEYAGWSGSFGFVVVIDHNYGYRTIYAHCSKLLINKGDLVRKGQVIAQVGSTGISTGPHLHYEVRKWQNAINPVPFLELDMFTASTKVW